MEADKKMGQKENFHSFYDEQFNSYSSKSHHDHGISDSCMNQVEQTQKLEEEVQRLKAVLLEREEELGSKNAQIARLRGQIIKQEESNTSYRDECGKLIKEQTIFRSEIDSLKDTVNDLHKVIEELAIRYDKKCKENNEKERDMEVLGNKLEKKFKALTAAKYQLEAVQQANQLMKKNLNKAVKNLTIGCKLVDSFAKQLQPKKDALFKEKMKDSISQADQVYECYIPKDFDEDKNSSDEQDLESLFKEPKELPGPVYEELKKALVSRSKTSDNDGLRSTDRSVTNIDSSTQEISSLNKSNETSPNLDSKQVSETSFEGISIASFMGAAQKSNLMNRNYTEEHFGDDTDSEN